MRESQFDKPCKTATAELEDWRNAIKEEREDPDRQFAYVAEKRIGRDLARIEANAPDADCRIVAGALNRWTGILKKNGPVDHSVVDYKVAEELLVKAGTKTGLQLHCMQCHPICRIEKASGVPITSAGRLTKQYRRQNKKSIRTSGI